MICMTEYNSYQFFAVFSKLNTEMVDESERSLLMNKFKTVLSDAIQETGMIDGGVIVQRDKGIGPAGSNRTFCFDVYVPREAMIDPETFEGEEFREVVELYLENLDNYDWMQVLNKDSDIVFGRAEDIHKQLD